MESKFGLIRLLFGPTAILARDVPDRFRMACKPLIQPLIHAMGHQHAKVRSVAVKAVGYTVQQGPLDIFDEFWAALAQRTLDHSPLVRKSLYTVRGVGEVFRALMKLLTTTSGPGCRSLDAGL